MLAPVRAAREATRAVRAYGAATREHSGTPLVRQWRWTWWLAYHFDIPAETTYRFRMFRRDQVTPFPRFLHWHDAATLFRFVASRAARKQAETLADKRLFAAWCAAEELPTAPILASFEGGRMTGGSLLEGKEPQMDLFAKWGTRYGGDDTSRWRWTGEGYVDDAGRSWQLREILTQLAERSRTGVVLLQPRLVNHPEIRRLSPGALSTIRVMTTRDPSGAARFLAGVLRMGTGAATADNFAQGGIASPVDASNGIAGPARRVDEFYRTHVFESHPDTGVPITGATVPLWNDAIRLALAAHDLLGPIACVGWDVAVLEDGPVLLEGNWNPCTKLLQVATQTPLLSTDFTSTFDAWLDSPECGIASERAGDADDWSP